MSSKSSSGSGISARRIGAYLIAFIALTVFIIKILIHYSLLKGAAIPFTDVFVAILPILFAVAIMLIIRFRGLFSNLILFIVSLALAYLIIVPVYLAGL